MPARMSKTPRTGTNNTLKKYNDMMKGRGAVRDRSGSVRGPFGVRSRAGIVAAFAANRLKFPLRVSIGRSDARMLFFTAQ